MLIGGGILDYNEITDEMKIQIESESKYFVQVNLMQFPDILDAEQELGAISAVSQEPRRHLWSLIMCVFTFQLFLCFLFAIQ